VNVKDGTLEFRGYPYVGYTACPSMAPVVLKAESVEHLLSIVRRSPRLCENVPHGWECAPRCIEEKVKRASGNAILAV